MRINKLKINYKWLCVLLRQLCAQNCGNKRWHTTNVFNVAQWNNERLPAVHLFKPKCSTAAAAAAAAARTTTTITMPHKRHNYCHSGTAVSLPRALNIKYRPIALLAAATWRWGGLARNSQEVKTKDCHRLKNAQTLEIWHFSTFIWAQRRSFNELSEPPPHLLLFFSLHW